MATTDSWADFDTLKHNVKHNTVDRLKIILTAFNDECHTNFTKSGKKQDIIDRITRELDGWRRSNSIDRWAKGKVILTQVRTTGSYAARSDPYPPGSSNNLYSASGSNPVFPSVNGNSHLPRFDPYAPPRRPPPVPPSQNVSATPSLTPNIRFKPSPFFRVEKAVSNVVECPESTSQMDRRQQHLSFTITPDVLQKLSSQSPKYTLRLYCTSSTYHSTTPAFRPTQTGLCPIEFPPTCEVRVNTVQLQANLKGMKKKPGTAPPPDLGKSVRLTPGASNRVEMVYVNSQQPVVVKKYYLVVMLVEVTTVEQMIDRLRKGKYKPSQEILAKMVQASIEEEDIIAGHQKMSLKCPLSYTRITIPCRSSHCVHSQCFDAFSWFSVMEQTTTWACPVCEKVLDVGDLIVDGYFDSILKATPEDIEDVIVEADGQWHTSDDVYGSADWLAAHPPVAAEVIKRRSPTPKPAIDPEKSHPSNAEIVILDSDDDEDEDEGRVKRELSPSADGTQRLRTATHTSLASIPRSQTQESDVIDLTQDSDDEDAPSSPVVQPTSKKRKVDDRDALSPTEGIWKKGRTGSSTPAAPSVPLPQRRQLPTSDMPFSSPPASNHIVLPPISPNRLPNSYPQNQSFSNPSYAAGPASLPPRPDTAVLLNQYPSSSRLYPPRANGSSPPSLNGWRR